MLKRRRNDCHIAGGGGYGGDKSEQNCHMTVINDNGDGAAAAADNVPNGTAVHVNIAES